MLTLQQLQLIKVVLTAAMTEKEKQLQQAESEQKGFFRTQLLAIKEARISVIVEITKLSVQELKRSS